MGGGRPDTEIRGARSQKDFFWPFGPHFGLKIKGGPGPPGPSPDSPLSTVGHGKSTTLNYYTVSNKPS